MFATLIGLNSSQAAVWSWSGGGGANTYWNNNANWGFAGIPANGDTVIFPASQPNLLNTNNIPGLVLNQVRFVGAVGGYDLRGNAFTLTNSIVATNTIGANTIENSITLSNATVLIVVSNAASLTLDGNLSGPAGVTKAGLGTLLYQCIGNNTYTGTTLVAAGTLQFNVSSINAVSGPLVIGDGTGTGNPTVVDLQLGEMENLPSVTVNLNGLLNLNNVNEPAFTTNLTLSGGTIATGSGTFTLLPNAGITASGAAASYIAGNLNIGSGTLTLQGSSATLFFNANVSGSANIVQNGAIQTGWSGANTYKGNYTANGSGYVWFYSSQALGNTNNNLTLNGLSWVALSGNVNLTNQAVTINSTNLSYQINVYAPSTNTWTANLTNNSGLTVDVVTNAELSLISTISGPGSLTKIDQGILLLGGINFNTYAGPTTLSGGTLLLDKDDFSIAVPSPFVIGSNTVVRLLNDFQIDSFTTPVTMKDASLLDLNGFTELLGPVSLQGAQIAGNGGYIILSSNITVNASFVARSVISGIGEIYGSIITITNASQNWSPDLVISANLESAGVTNGLIKAGAGEVSLTGNNTFTGPVIVNGGNLWAQTSTAFGATNAPVTVNNGGSLYLWGTGLDFGLKPLILNGPGYFFGAVSCNGSSSWEGSVTLATDSTLYQFAASSLTFSGPVGGPGSYIKSGPGTNTFAGAGENTYNGQTFVNDGTLNLGKVGFSIGYGTLTIGDGVGSASSAVVREFSNFQIDGTGVILNADGFFDLNSHNDLIGRTVIFNGSANIQNAYPGVLSLDDGTTVTVTSGYPSIYGGYLNIGDTNTTCTSTVATNSGFYIYSTVTGAAALAKAGPGFGVLVSSNSYSGPTFVQQGSLWLDNSSALGTTNNGVVVSSFASLVLNGFFLNITNKTLTLNGPGWYGSYGALDSQAGTNIWAGPVIVNGNSTLDSWAPGVQLHINGPISGPGSLELFGYYGGGGTHFFEGAAANTYAGMTMVDMGSTLVLNKSISYSTVSNIVVEGTLRLGNNEQIAPAAEVEVYYGGWFDFASYYQEINTLNGEGDITFGAGSYLLIGGLGGSSEFDGVMSGTGFVGGFTLRKYGTGTFTLGWNNTYQNATYVSAGTLMVDGSQPQSSVYVAPSATLGGVGTVGAITANGSISPGFGTNGYGTLTSSNVTFSSSGNLNVQLNGPVPGAEYDQLNVTGTNILANATLSLNLAFTSPVAVGQQFTIINNDKTDPISGIFLGYPEGATYTQSGYTVKISYFGGTGNDVVLTLATIPGAVSSSAVTAGDGSHAIDPNGCNNLNLAITNTSGAPMTDVIATLSTTTEGVVITQPYTTYPNIPANGNGTNSTPFQVSVLPSFACGSPINLQLVVNSSLGAFTINYVLGSGEPSALPVRYDISGNVVIPDVGSVNSTNLVTGFAAGPLVKVVASLYLTHPIDADLTNISLISPDGTTVLLSSANGGAGQNYGSGLTPDASRTTFDDAAITSITSGVAPFAGTFRPQSPLSAFSGNATPNGNWHLHIADGFGGSLGTLRGWSLFLYGTSCSPGGGACDYCLASLSGSITNTDFPQTNRFSLNGIVASCGSPKAFPGSVSGIFHYRAYEFTNTSPNDACVTVTTTSAGDVETVAYLLGFYPASLTNNYYVGDSGYSTGINPPYGLNGPTSFSFTVPSGWPFFVVVNELSPGAGVGSYTLQLSGLPCPPPALNIQPVAPDKARLYWDTSAGGYVLEAESNLVNNAWGSVTNEPIVSGGSYNVTNSAVLPNSQFYRLRKP